MAEQRHVLAGALRRPAVHRSHDRHEEVMREFCELARSEAEASRSELE
jgi:hypothetical protein